MCIINLVHSAASELGTLLSKDGLCLSVKESNLLWVTFIVHTPPKCSVHLV